MGDAYSREGFRVARGCSIVIVNTNPNKVATTLCTSHTGLGMTVLSHNVCNNRVGGATRIRGCPKFGSVVKPRLTGGVCRDSARFNTGLLCNDIANVAISRGKAGRIGASDSRCRTRTIVVTAKSRDEGLNIPNRRECDNHNISCYTIYSKTFCHGGHIIIINNNSSTVRRNLCLTGLYRGIGIVRHHSRLHTRGVLRSHTFRGRGVSFA